MGKTDVLEQLGWCYRSNWSDFDGRTLQHQIDEWVNLDDTAEAIQSFRLNNNMCPKGDGHWGENCSYYHEEQL